jgi:hypothetical protein
LGQPSRQNKRCHEIKGVTYRFGCLDEFLGSSMRSDRGFETESFYGGCCPLLGAKGNTASDASGECFFLLLRVSTIKRVINPTSFIRARCSPHRWLQFTKSQFNNWSVNNWSVNNWSVNNWSETNTTNQSQTAYSLNKVFDTFY